MLSRTRNSIVVCLFLIIVLVNQSLFKYIFYFIYILSYFVFYFIAANRVCCSVVVVAVVVCRLVQSFYANTRETVCDLQ